MSVKFEKETIREAPIAGGRKVDFAHEVGEKLTGGESQTGYLAVRCNRTHCDQWNTDGVYSVGIPQATSIQSSAYENAHLWLTGSTSGSSRILDRS